MPPGHQPGDGVAGSALDICRPVGPGLAASLVRPAHQQRGRAADAANRSSPRRRWREATLLQARAPRRALQRIRELSASARLRPCRLRELAALPAAVLDGTFVGASSRSVLPTRSPDHSGCAPGASTATSSAFIVPASAASACRPCGAAASPREHGDQCRANQTTTAAVGCWSPARGLANGASWTVSRSARLRGEHRPGSRCRRPVSTRRGGCGGESLTVDLLQLTFRDGNALR